MKRPVLSDTRCPASPASVARHSGYTLVEIMVATTLSLLLLGAVIRMFGDVGQSITDSRAMLEVSDRLRLVATRLQMDLAGVTATMNPPRRPENNEGYFEYIEGPFTAAASGGINTDNASATDPTVGDWDDILMFTTRSAGRPFVGRFNATTITSDIAEVAWFVRGRTLHRRVLLVVPSQPIPNTPSGFYANYDVSASMQNGVLVANSLGDLTRRECRFAHPHWTTAAPYGWPFDARNWKQLGLPTLRECSDSTYSLSAAPFASAPAAKTTIDFWANKTSVVATDSFPWADNVLRLNGTRIADDVILTNVIGFDVKAWDPDAGTAGMYVDMGSPVAGRFSGNGSRVDRTVTTSSAFLPGVYDTWSTHYENVGRYPADASAGRGTNGFDDAGNNAAGNLTPADGIVDGADEMLTSPPYPYPLRGIQVKIRVFEPDSRQIVEWTVVQDFLPQ